MTVDFGRTASDYARHRAGFPPATFTRLAALGVGLAGQRLLDLGAGTGTLARGFARQGCRVIALDRARPLLVAGRGLPGGAAADPLVAAAERVPLRSGALDAVTAGQCWHWFDRPRAAAEARRLLRPGGRVAIAHFDWLPLPGNVVAATEDLILAHNPGWGGAGTTGLYPAWLADLARAGFDELETFSFDCPVAYDHAAWRGRIRASAGVAASLAPPAVARFDADLAALLRDRWPAEPLSVPHRVWALVGRAP